MSFDDDETFDTPVFPTGVIPGTLNVERDPTNIQRNTMVFAKDYNHRIIHGYTSEANDNILMPRGQRGSNDTRENIGDSGRGAERIGQHNLPVKGTPILRKNHQIAELYQRLDVALLKWKESPGDDPKNRQAALEVKKIAEALKGQLMTHYAEINKAIALKFHITK